MRESRWTILDREFPEWRTTLAEKTPVEFVALYAAATGNPHPFAGWMALNTASHRMAHEERFSDRKPTRQEIAADRAK